MRKLIYSAPLLLFFASAPVLFSQTLASISTLLSTPNGEQSSIATLGAGKVTVISFWATWCKPCKEEMKSMQPVYERLKNSGVQYIAVSVDNTKTMDRVGPYIASKGYTFPVLLDANSDLFHLLNGTEVPYTVIFNSDGTLHSKHEGYLEGDQEKLEKEVMAMLASGTAAPTQSTPK